jgi:hypothetical protein
LVIFTLLETIDICGIAGNNVMLSFFYVCVVAIRINDLQKGHYDSDLELSRPLQDSSINERWNLFSDDGWYHYN